MLSKDHFSNVLNEPAGRVASQDLKWVVPQLIAAWDDERIDIERTLNRIIHGVLHHPALRMLGDDGAADGRRLMFQVVEKWWGEKDERERQQLHDQLSRSGVEQGRNHKEGVNDIGHGCGKPLGLPNMGTSQSSSAIGGPAASAVLSGLSALGNEFGGSGGQGRQSGGSSGIGNIAGEAVGGGVLGGLVGGLVGGVGSDLLGGAFGGDKDDTEQYKSEGYGKDGSYSQTYTEVARHNRLSQGDKNR
jgi:Heterokaryon incompatibility protein Het-C